MNEEPEIKISILENGEVNIDVKHTTGAQCRELSKPYTDLFEETAEQLKPEFHVARQPNRLIDKSGH